MARFTLLSTFLLLATGQVLARLGQTIPNRYFVEFDEGHDVFARDGSPANIHKRMYDTLEARGLRYKKHFEYRTSGVLVGMSVTLENPSDLERLHAIPGIQLIRPVTWSQGPPSSLAKRERFTAYDPKSAPVSDALHYLTGVDKLHAAGVTGKGIKIGIIDTGVDYRNPALGGGLGSGFKVSGGFDYTGDDPDHPKPDLDPEDCDGHGTHVAGIIGANPGVAPFNLTGVAYEAELKAYKVGGCEGGLPTDAIVKALTQAHEDGCDVVNLSLGSPGGWANDPTDSKQKVISKLAAKGMIVVVAAGNEGADGSWYAGSPASGSDSISVANVQAPIVPLQTVTVTLGDEATIDPIVYFDIFPLTNRTDPIPIYALDNSTSFGCKKLPDSVPNLENYVVIAKTGGCSLTTLAKNLRAKGGELALVYGAKRFESLGEQFGDFAGSLIQTADGEFLTKQFITKQKVAITFPKGGALVDFPAPDGGLLSPSSTYGPTFDLDFQPSVGAFGGRILSTVPLAQEAFGIKSGTSMASPYVAGCAALYLQVRGKNAEVARQAKNLFQTTSIPLVVNNSEATLLQTTTVQGAGMIDAYAAAHATTLLSPAQLLLNDTAHFKGTHTFTVKNIDKKEKKYSVDHFPAGTAITIRPGSVQASTGPVELSKSFASVELSTTSFTLAPNQEQTITAKFTPPKGLDPKTLPVYSGFIQVEAEGEGDLGMLHVSYMGVAGSLFDQPVLDTTDELSAGLYALPAIFSGEDKDGQVIVQQKEQTYDLTGKTTPPQLLFRLAFGSRKVDIDLVPPSFELDKIPSPIPVIGKFDNFTFSSRNTETGSTSFLNYTLDNELAFVNGTLVPSGTYKFLISALRVTGDPTNPDHYDYWLSPATTFKFAKDRKNAAEGATDDGEEVGQPLTKKPWFIAIVSLGGFLVVAAAAGGALWLTRRRKSTIRSEAAFVPAMGAYKPLVDENRVGQSHSDTAYYPGALQESHGRYSDH
ncbi:hypothetical protein V5O48_000242 [Marasmius crinis-equi]|uniref:Uncharacterized protein n=1 Tax=Marasmius crinis-equi TaxID=585013 RepID=A0ABR3G1Z0_9AGAR